MTKFRDYINEEYVWLTKPKRDFIERMKDDSRFEFKINPHTNTIKIYKANKRTGKVTQGLEIFPDGSAIDMTVDLAVSKVMRSVKDWEKILK